MDRSYQTHGNRVAEVGSSQPEDQSKESPMGQARDKCTRIHRGE